MPEQVTARAKALAASLNAFTLGQKVLAVLGVALLVLGGLAFGRWVTTPSYVPLYASPPSAEDAAAITAQLTTDGVPFEIEGGTILVPAESKDIELLNIAGAGVAPTTTTGYSILDSQGMTSSEFQQKVTYQRALEGEISSTIEAIDGVEVAVVHLAVPEQTVFVEDAGATTASVLLKTRAGKDLTDAQVEAIVNLVASSVPDLDPADVTVSDSDGLLSTGATGGGGARDDQTEEYEEDTASSVQAMLDRVLGPGNAIATVTAEMNYDQTARTTETFTSPNGTLPLSETTSNETYTGTGAGVGGALGDNGVLGMDAEEVAGDGTGADGGYTKESSTVNNSVDKVTENTTVAPGTVRTQQVAIVVDTAAAAAAGIPQITQMATTAAGIDPARGDVITVTQAAFDTTAADAAAADLAAAAAADAAASQQQLIVYGAIAALVLLLLVVALVLWRRAAKRRRREVVDIGELERLYAAPAEVVLPDGEVLALTESERAKMLTPVGPSPAALRREEVGELVDQQPSEVADLLRGWLNEPKKKG